MAKDMNIENYEKIRKEDLVEAIKQKNSNWKLEYEKDN
nr:Rho termination factor N-terminal domain-containing protein [Acholeplasma laidlawii]